MSMGMPLCPMRAFRVVAMIAAVIGGHAFPQYQQDIPNGKNVMVENSPWPGVGHLARAGGGDRNPFGKAFQDAGHQWTTSLCEADSDGDGQSNGLELGDPFCTWTKNGEPPYRSYDISHPGFASSMTGVSGGAGNASVVTYKGYLVDRYCYGLAKGGGLALDGTNVIKDPSQHTLHCLRDPPACRSGGYYLAVKNSVTGEYDIKFQFDAAGNVQALALLDSLVGDRVPGRFTVTAVGTTTGDGILKDVSLVECFPSGSPQCDSVCNSTGNGCGGGSQEIVLAAPVLLWLHVCCMLVSWGCLLPLGVLWARNMRLSDKKLCATPIWFQGHRILQMVGWSFQLLGFIFIFLAKGGFGSASHFKAPHEIFGLTVVILGTLQPLNAQLRHLPFIGHAHEDGSKTTGRIVWEILHKGQGYIAVLLGAVTVILGILYAMKINFGGALVPLAIGVASLSLGGQLCVGVVAEVLKLLQKAKLLGAETSDEESNSNPKSSDEEGKTE